MWIEPASSFGRQPPRYSGCLPPPDRILAYMQPTVCPWIEPRTRHEGWSLIYSYMDHVHSRPLMKTKIECLEPQ